MRLGEVANLRHPRSERAVAQPPRDEAAEAAAPSEEGSLLPLQDTGERVAHALAQHPEVARHVCVLRRHNLMQTLAVRHEGAEPSTHLCSAVDGANRRHAHQHPRGAHQPKPRRPYFSFSAPSSRARLRRRRPPRRLGPRADLAQRRVRRLLSVCEQCAASAAQPPPQQPSTVRASGEGPRPRLAAAPSPNELRGDAGARACASAPVAAGAAAAGRAAGRRRRRRWKAERRGGGGVPKGGGGGVAARRAARGGDGRRRQLRHGTGCASSMARS